MNEKNELNDIILNKSAQNDRTKKVLLAVATFAIILIVVVIGMNQFGANKESALPQVPKTTVISAEEVIEEPAYSAPAAEAVATEEPSVSEPVLPAEKEAEPIVTVEPAEEAVQFEEPEIVKEPVYTEAAAPKAEPKPAPAVTKPVAVQKPKPSGKYDPKTQSVVSSGSYYVQVGSFARLAPSKAFLKKITDRGYTYTYHKVVSNGHTLNKVIVGPFKTEAAAREALPIIKKSVISGAFIVKI